MTDQNPSAAAPAGWYADPHIAPKLRWWDGTQWTEDVYDSTVPQQPQYGQQSPVQPQYGVQQPYGTQQQYYSPNPQQSGAQLLPAVGPEVSVDTPFAWIIPILPILSSIALLFWQPHFVLPAASSDLSEIYASIFAIYTPAYFIAIGLGLLSYAAIVVLAYFDYRQLGRVGVVRPFQWGWAFLAGAPLYIIGRTVVLHRRAQGRGKGPLWVLIGVWVLGILLGIVWSVMFGTTLESELNSYTQLSSYS